MCVSWGQPTYTRFTLSQRGVIYSASVWSLFLNITKTILIPSSIPLLIFFHEIRCITTWIFA